MHMRGIIQAIHYDDNLYLTSLLVCMRVQEAYHLLVYTYMHMCAACQTHTHTHTYVHAHAVLQMYVHTKLYHITLLDAVSTIASIQKISSAII